METQICTTCGRELKTQHFAKHNGMRVTVCRDCVRGFILGETVDITVKPCSCCNEVKSINEFNNDSNTYDGLSSICKTCDNIMTALYIKTEKGKAAIARYFKSEKGKVALHKSRAKRRGFGFEPLAPQKFGNEEYHHLHLENNHNYGVFIPDFLHEFIRHNSFSGKGMTRINAIAIQCWLDDELYMDD